MTVLVEELVPDELWAVMEPLLSPPPRPWWGGRVRHHPGSHLLRRDLRYGPHLHLLAPAAARELGCGSPATVSSLPASSRVAWKGRGGHPAFAQPAGGTVAGKPAWWKLLAVAACPGGASGCLPTGQNGQDSRRDGKRSVCGRIGCMARSSARTAGSRASLISPESAVRPGLAQFDASSRVAVVGCSGALTAESGEDLG